MRVQRIFPVCFSLIFKVFVLIVCLLGGKAYNKCYMLSTPNILGALSLIFRETLNNAVHILGAQSMSD